MNVHLLHPDADFDLDRKPPPHHDALGADLELGRLVDAMADGDAFLADVAGKVLFAGLSSDATTVLYRQKALDDVLKNTAVVRELHGIAGDALEARRKHWWGGVSKYASSVLFEAVRCMEVFVVRLRRLKALADAHASRFGSAGFSRLFATLSAELTDAYLAEVEDHLGRLGAHEGVLITVRLGEGNHGIGHTLARTPREPAWLWWVENVIGFEVGQKLDGLRDLAGFSPAGLSFTIPDRDEAGAKAIGDLKDRGINLVANALARSVEHVAGFFTRLRFETAFYLGGVNLHARLSGLGAPTCFPRPESRGSRALTFTGLYDPALALRMGRAPVGNTLRADGKDLLVITGANQGGKSTLLRAIGAAQIMMHAGLFVGAEAFAGSLATGLFTHYRREEDATMRSGKLDEELARMSRIIDAVGPAALVLFNESFASTDEREASEIAREIVDALLAAHVRIAFVTHMYTFAHELFARGRPDALFLRAGRLPDGTRTFQLAEGEPTQTSHGQDLYRLVFGGA